MEAKEYLDQIRILTNKIKHMNFMLNEYDRLASAPNSPTFGVEHTNPNINTEAPFIKWLNKKFELEKKIKVKQDELNKLKGEALEMIEAIPDETIQVILTYRYFHFMSWNEITFELNYAKSYIYEMHRKGLELLNEKNIVKHS